ncbi:3',5'-cyclic adenosine monophosphate phosphodiesterase CpdA [Tateyamaria omphalii]|uniref:metallophosphoesterase n=1 Tax=Tateyamaria omphalii TaxID=299262 RepID=UPI00167728F3|nr:metallophosphoesterase [Tateyamaria omphalii]GGX66705.1 3',5'-cyclic adenosine monophosphate phosphodiesterase CpdA [Tateyamaria omphalii]
MLIAHLTDFHCMPDGALLGGKLDSRALAADAVRTVTGPEFSPDALVVTGDLTHDGSLSAMRAARAATDLSDIPVFVVPGGHDDYETFAKVFPEHVMMGNDTRPVLRAETVGTHRFVCINTLGEGELPNWTEAMSEELDTVLSEEPDMPTVVVLHHPPFQCQIPVSAYCQDPTVTWARPLHATIARHPQVKLIPCGHVHRVFQRIWAGALVSSGSSTVVQVDPNFSDFWTSAAEDRRNFSLILEPPNFLLYHWDGSEFTVFNLPLKRDFPRVA